MTMQQTFSSTPEAAGIGVHGALGTAPLPDLMVLPDDELNGQAREAAQPVLYEDYVKMREMVDEALSGFWQAPPRTRWQNCYAPHLPVFRDPGIDLLAWLDGERKGTGVDYDSTAVLQSWQAQQPVLAPEIMADSGALEAHLGQLAAWQTKMQRLGAGMAEMSDLLMPYWAGLWLRRPPEVRKMLRELRRMQDKLVVGLNADLDALFAELSAALEGES